MKHIKLVSVFVVVLISFMACNQSNEVEISKSENFDSPVYATIDYSDIINGIDEATFTADLTFNSILLNYSFMTLDNKFSVSNAAFKNIPWLFRYDFTKHIGLILRKLNLDENQKTSVKGFMKEYHEGIKLLVKKFYDINKPIFEQARADKKAIMEDLKAGIITREEAGVKIKELNAKTKDAILSNPENEQIKKDMCSLGDLLFANIKSILAGDQIEKWDNMVKRIKRPC